MSPEDTVLGFKPDTGNKALRAYCLKVLKLKGVQDINHESFNSSDFLIKARSDSPYESQYGYTTESHEWNSYGAQACLTCAILTKGGRSSDYKGGDKIFVDSVSGTHAHPRIPIIINHPDIPELRWCHADYAAIPTKNGYNIIEMIT